MNLRKFQYPIMIAVGYIVTNVLEVVYSVTSQVAGVVGLVLMVFPRIPRILRPIGVGMFLASDWIQQFVTSGTEWAVSTFSNSGEK